MSDEATPVVDLYVTLAGRLVAHDLLLRHLYANWAAGSADPKAFIFSTIESTIGSMDAAEQRQVTATDQWVWEHAQVALREFGDQLGPPLGGASQRAVPIRFHVTVLSIDPVNQGRLIAFASVEIDIAGVVIGLAGVRVVTTGPGTVGIEAPRYRRGTEWPVAVVLPDELCRAVATVVFAALDEASSRNRPGRCAATPRNLRKASRFANRLRSPWR